MLAVVLAAIGLGGLAASRGWIGGSRAARVPAMALLGGRVQVALSYAGFQMLTAGTQVGEWSRVLWFAGALTVPRHFFPACLFTLIGDALARETVRAHAARRLADAGEHVGRDVRPAARRVHPAAARSGWSARFFTLAMVYGSR